MLARQRINGRLKRILENLLGKTLRASFLLSVFMIQKNGLLSAQCFFAPMEIQWH